MLQFYQRNGRPYPISDADVVLVEITQAIHKVTKEVTWGREAWVKKRQEQVDRWPRGLAGEEY